MKITWEKITLTEFEGMFANSPLGPVHFGSPLSPSGLDAEVMNTDFVITHKNLISINMTKGVEAVRLMTGYKILICFAPLIPKETTKSVLELIITGKIAHNTIDIPDSLKNKINNDITVVFPNGNMIGCNKDDPDYQDNIELYKKTSELVGGYFHTK